MLFLPKKEVESKIQTTIWFGKYRILKRIGVGGFSEVYLAEHLKLKALRAIKQIPRSKDSMTSFLSEAQLLKSLKHPGIPIIFDIEEDENNLYVIEEYIEGESLEAFVLHQNILSEEPILQIGIALCDILQYLHGLKPYPLLYLDMKPQHIFLCAGQVKLVDFGISTYCSRETAVQQDYSVPAFGTLGFVAPEQEENRLPGVEADIYGVGRILAFLAEWEKVKPKGALGRIIKQATQQEISRRYPSAAALQQELTELKNARDGKKSRRKKKHLLKTIAVCGSEERVGTTHFAVSLVSCLNASGYRSCFIEKNDSRILWKIRGKKRGLVEKDGFVYYGYFCGALYEGQTEQMQHFSGVAVVDYGATLPDTAELLKADEVILLLGASDWEKEASLCAAERYRYCSSLALVCNYGNGQRARAYARATGRSVYCYPLDEDAFSVTKKKRCFFQKLFQKKGW